MMNNARWSCVVLTGLACSVLFLAPRSAQADWSWRRSWHHDEHHRYGTVVVWPWGATRLAVGGSPYYYRRGCYYRHEPRGYVVIPAPMGAVVPALPEEHRIVVIDGVTYHEYDGVYYKGGLSGYTVVPIAGSTTVVNIPNKNGSYTPVTLQSKDGLYIGPQGEVYPTFPTVQQLQAMYGK